MASRRRYRPPHPLVDWASEIPLHRNRWQVLVRCSECGQSRYLESIHVVTQIRAGEYSALCTHCKWPGEQLKSRMERPPHPAVDWNPVIVGRHRRIRITCPACGIMRTVGAGPVSAKVRAGKFTGLCLPCSPNAQKREWLTLGPGRKVDPSKGYVRLSLAAIDVSDVWLYDAMRNGRTYVLEHRMVMARELGRPLTRNELVDHRDGVKTRNDPANLRLYRRGKNDDGSGCGYGTYYDEWQRAEAEIKRLRTLLMR